MGMMADKDCEQVVSLLAPLCKKVITVTVADNPRSIDAVELAEIASRYCPNVTAANDYAEALSLTEGEQSVLIAGSLYLAGGIRELALEFYNKR